MARFSNAELRKFRDTSRCSACVHYSGCQLWLALLLMNDELGHPGLDIIVPDITKACPMFFPWSAESARRASAGSGELPSAHTTPATSLYWPGLIEPKYLSTKRAMRQADSTRQ